MSSAPTTPLRQRMIEDMAVSYVLAIIADAAGTVATGRPPSERLLRAEPPLGRLLDEKRLTCGAAVFQPARAESARGATPASVLIQHPALLVCAKAFVTPSVVSEAPRNRWPPFCICPAIKSKIRRRVGRSK